MKIVKMVNQYRRDFRAVFECENCGDKETKSGYDDRNFHDNVIPTMECRKCGKTRKDLGIIGVPTETKYKAWETV